MERALANHLLQSTVFAAVAWMVTLLLRNNHARTRYWVWLAASMKFFVPFAWFVEMGRRMSVSVTPEPRVAVVMETVSRPFVVPDRFVAAPVGFASSSASVWLQVLLGVWACGVAAVVILWFVRWRRVAAVVRAGSAWNAGREVGVDVIVSPTQMEPGVFGILRPVLCLPAGLAECLDAAQLDAVFAHEMCHVRYRDNLTAALHMVAEAVFWFHPLLWWIGARMLAERERACDEEVVRLGGDAEVYAGTILEICRRYVASPVACAAGISGSDLTKRIEAIMTNTFVTRLGIGKRLLLTFVGSVAIAVPIAVGLFSVREVQAQFRISAPPAQGAHVEEPVVVAQAAPAQMQASPQVKRAVAPAFEVASIRENPGPWHTMQGYSASGSRLTLEAWWDLELVQEAYGLKKYQVVSTETKRTSMSEPYDLMAKAEGDGAPTRTEFRRMLQTLLADRFKLKVHREMREMPVYVLVVGKNGPRFKEGDPGAEPVPPHIGVNGRNQNITLVNETLEKLADSIPGFLFLDRPVVDETGLKGKYDMKLEATPEFRINNSPQPGDLSVFTAIEEQLGLKLEGAKRPVEVLVVDHMEKPSEN